MLVIVTMVMIMLLIIIPIIKIFPLEFIKGSIIDKETTLVAMQRYFTIVSSYVYNYKNPWSLINSLSDCSATIIINDSCSTIVGSLASIPPLIHQS